MRSPPYIDRRTTIKWVWRHRRRCHYSDLAVSAAAEAIAGAVTGYGTDPDLTRSTSPAMHGL